MYISTVPGFSSRSSVHVVKQFPQRDEAAMSEHEQEAGWSNSAAAKDAPEDVTPDVQTPETPEPGFSNGLAVKSAEPEPEKAAEDAEPEAEKPAAKKAAKKTAAKKG